MANLYAEERADALADITEDGVAGHILRGVAEHACSFLMLDYETAQIDGDLIRSSDILFMIPALGLTIVPDAEQDQIVVDDARPEFVASVGTYRIVTVKPFQPGGVVIFYDVQGRKL